VPPRNRARTRTAKSGEEDVPEIAEQAETLQEAITDDYTTGIVPLAKRQPTWHLQALMMNFWAGFSYVFVGFTLNEAGYTLLKSTLIILLGTAIYWVYGTAAAWIGARTGQTHALLSRSIFGVRGSILVSLVIVFAQIGWVGFQGNLTVQIWSGLFGWGHVLLIGVVLTIAMITNNVLGFTGVASFARYIVAPLMFAWLMFLVIKAFTTEGSSVLAAHPHVTAPMGFPAAITVVIGFIMWGEEPDYFRFAKPSVGVITRIYSFSLIFGFVLSGVGGWVMGQLAGTADYGPAVKTITDYSLFGATWLAFILVLVGQIAINDGNYYVVTNAAQNILAAIPWWKRQYTCIVAAALGGLAAWIIPYVITSGFEKVAAVGAIGIPTATLIMVADHFAVPRLFGISRPLDKVPTWRQAGRCNWPAVVALLIATGLGGWASGLLPVAAPNVNLGVVPLETWVLGALLYLGGIALLARTTAPATMRSLLGFSEPALESAQHYPADAVIDVVSLAGLEAGLVPSYEPT
jgi:purine-cytosine permease-like protein